MYEQQLHLDLHRMRTDELAHDAEQRHLAATLRSAAGDHEPAHRRERNHLARHRAAHRRSALHMWGRPAAESHPWLA